MHGCVCAGEPRTEPGRGPLFLLFHMAFISPVTQEWYFSLTLLIFISLQMRMFLDLSNASLAVGGKEGGCSFYLHLLPSPALPWPPSCFMSLPMKLIKINMFSFGVACNLADGGVLLEGQQLHTSGSALGKKPPSPAHAHMQAHEPAGQLVLGMEKGETKALLNNGEVGGTSLMLLPKSQGTQGYEGMNVENFQTLQSGFSVDREPSFGWGKGRVCAAKIKFPPGDY